MGSRRAGRIFSAASCGRRSWLTTLAVCALLALTSACGASETRQAADRFIGYLNEGDYTSAAAQSCSLPDTIIDATYLAQTFDGYRPFEIVRESRLEDDFIKVEVTHGDGSGQLVPFVLESDGEWKYCPVTSY